MSDATWRKSKGPNEKLDYTFDFSAPEEEGGPWLDAGDTIASGTVVATPAGLTISGVAPADANTSIRARITGGVLGTTYSVVCHAVATPSGQEPERTLSLRIVTK